VEPQPPSSSTPPPPPAAPPPPPGGGSAAQEPAASTPPIPNAEIVICPVCREPRADDARFCEECGHDYGGQAPAPVEERGILSGPILWAIMLFWAALAIGGLFFLYNALWAI
jgi:hypothetical protein